MIPTCVHDDWEIHLESWVQITLAKSSLSTKQTISFSLPHSRFYNDMFILSNVKHVRSRDFKADKAICPRIKTFLIYAVQCTSFVSTRRCTMICMCSSAVWEGKYLLRFESGGSSSSPSSLILTLIFVLTANNFRFLLRRKYRPSIVWCLWRQR
jgi:hypothetical protein